MDHFGRARVAGVLATLAVVSLAVGGCELKRPKGAYRGGSVAPEEVGREAGSAETQEDSSLPTLPTPSDDAGAAPDGDAGTAAPDNPLAKLQGDYEVRFDTVNTTTHDTLGTIRTTLKTYGVMRVVLNGDTLEGTEWLCTSSTSQTATQGAVNTEIKDEAYNAFTEVTRTLDVDTKKGTFTTSPGTRRQGWRVTGDSSRIPTDPNTQGDRYLDPDADGHDGLTTTVTASASIGVLAGTCHYYTTSYVTSHYDTGVLDDAGLLESAEVRVDEQEADAWDARGTTPVCSTSDVDDAKPGTRIKDEVHFAKLPQPLVPTKADPKPCPTRWTL